MKKYLIALIMLYATLSFAQVDTRMTRINQTSHAPGELDTLIVDVEARSAGNGAVVTYGFQGSIRVSDFLSKADPQVIFLNQLFPAGNYNVTEDYRASKNRIRYVYTYDRGAAQSIGTSWTLVVRIHIVYQADEHPINLSWYEGSPHFFVLNSDNETVTGVEDKVGF